MTVHLITLGCPKNLIDSEIILANLVQNGFILTDAIEHADLVIINTCAFIQPAVKEAKDKIYEVLTYKKKGIVKKVLVAGCLVQRYQRDLEKAFPEVDGFFGLDYLKKIPDFIQSSTTKGFFVSHPKTLYSSSCPRIISTPSHYAYLKIADGCDNCCAYCLLPKIRGRFRSRNLADIIKEAEMLAKMGVKELILVAQDTTLYGQDLYQKPRLAQLLRQLNRIPSLIWIRLLYTHPAHFSFELIRMISELPRVAKYVDLPLQHISDRILAKMNRKVTRSQIEKLIAELRKIEGLTLRTSFIVGFPSETEKDFLELCDFVREQAFDHLGCFIYWRENGSPAYHFRQQVPAKIKLARFNELMALQQSIVRRRLRKLEGKKVEVLVDATTSYRGYDFVGRTEGDAPEIDGLVYIRGKNLKPGDFLKVTVIKSTDYDLFAQDATCLT